MACHLKRTKHLMVVHAIKLLPCGAATCSNHLIEEALIHVNRDELEEVLVKQGENLGNHIKVYKMLT